MFKSPMHDKRPVGRPRRTEEEILARAEGSTAKADPHGKPTKPYFNLRLNDYQKGLLAELAKKRPGLSIQYVVKEALMRGIFEELSAVKPPPKGGY